MSLTHALDRPYVLLAEDNQADELIIREALAQPFPKVEISVFRDGEQMMRWLDMIETEYAPLPDVILLDLNLPRFTGEQVLERLRGHRYSEDIPVVIVTSSDDAADRAAAARLGATRYFRKPSEYAEFLKLGEVIREILATSSNSTSAGH